MRAKDLKERPLGGRVINSRRAEQGNRAQHSTPSVTHLQGKVDYCLADGLAHSIHHSRGHEGHVLATFQVLEGEQGVEPAGSLVHTQGAPAAGTTSCSGQGRGVVGGGEGSEQQQEQSSVCWGRG